MLIFRKATKSDIDSIEKIYSDIHTCEEKGEVTIGWVRGVYPVREVAEKALLRGDLFVGEENGKVIGSAIINQEQVDVYSEGMWQYDAPENEVMVLHTLTISPAETKRGYGKSFVKFYEQYAYKRNCPYLRIDTNERNLGARALYKKLGYAEIGIVPCVFNGIKNVKMVLLEKKVRMILS